MNAPPNIPLSFRCYAIYEVDNPYEVERNIHGLIDIVDDSLHARETLNNGRIREREFFKISAETAYGIFSHVAKLRNDTDKLRLYEPTADQAQEQEIAETKTKRSNNSFKLLGIDAGEEITFLYDDNVTAKVVNDKNQIEYENETYSVTALACKLLHEKHGWAESVHVNGWMYFTKNGVSLSDLRDRIENQDIDNG